MDWKKESRSRSRGDETTMEDVDERTWRLHGESEWKMEESYKSIASFCVLVHGKANERDQLQCRESFWHWHTGSGFDVTPSS